MGVFLDSYSYPLFYYTLVMPFIRSITQTNHAIWWKADYQPERNFKTIYWFNFETTIAPAPAARASMPPLPGTLSIQCTYWIKVHISGETQNPQKRYLLLEPCQKKLYFPHTTLPRKVYKRKSRYRKEPKQ